MSSLFVCQCDLFVWTSHFIVKFLCMYSCAVKADMIWVRSVGVLLDLQTGVDIGIENIVPKLEEFVFVFGISCLDLPSIWGFGAKA